MVKSKLGKSWYPVTDGPLKWRYIGLSKGFYRDIPFGMFGHYSFSVCY